ncbi:GntR family transcriptional regulator [Cognatishimia sp. F0-27]|uniref:GntR family transcriptional regulator n=1 Tax=Cognatishimia sp. F0-27 TaxID=2816855 RepID=UPI001D0C928B|nr:GntR family transcriptional regulator [Cognatishimia sp. F0-27]MCC1495036.1 GntR family transcriptional regulator [Cognatishimia sp. F0-27]
MTGPRIDKLEQVNLRDSAYRALHDAFTRGEFAPGDVVSLRNLADQLGISMTPVREAVRRLVAEGALLDTPSRTLQVPAFDAQRMKDLKAGRLALETLVLDLAMDRMQPGDLARLRRTLSDAPEPDGPDLATNYAFHFALYRISRSDVLLPLIESLWLQYGAYLNRIIAHEAARSIDQHAYHHAILDALSDGNRDAARAALIDDIERSFRIVLPQLDDPDTPKTETDPAATTSRATPQETP